MENPRPARETSHAHVAELVDALVSGTSIGNDVEVRVLSCALSQKSFMLQGALCERAVGQMGWRLAGSMRTPCCFKKRNEPEKWTRSPCLACSVNCCNRGKLAPGQSARQSLACGGLSKISLRASEKKRAPSSSQSGGAFCIFCKKPLCFVA